MANTSRGTWYVSFELPRGNRKRARATETFPNEREAKKFARAKLAETQHVTAGTLNPHLPKRAIASAQMLEWLAEPDEDEKGANDPIPNALAANEKGTGPIGLDPTSILLTSSAGFPLGHPTR
jgi:hypothetical protein